MHLAKIRHYNLAMFEWSRPFSYFQRDSCNDQSTATILENFIAAIVLAPVGKSFGLIIEAGVVIIMQVPTITPIATHVRFCSCLQRNFVAAH